MNAATSFASPLFGFRNFLVQYRVPISAAIFLALIVEDVLLKDRPEHGFSVGGDAVGRMGAALVLIGLFMRSWAAGVLRKGYDLTIEGPYSLMRNPLYFGSACMMIGFCVMIGEVHDYVVMLGPIAVVYFLTILREEGRLSAKYASRWIDYVSRVPRLLPLYPNRYVACDWSIRQWLRSREYQAILGAAVGLAVIEVGRQIYS